MREIRVPRLNANEDEVELLSCVVPSGTHVTAGQHIGDVGTTKTAVQIDAPADGYLQWRSEVGALIAIGAVLAEFTESAEDTASARAADVSVPATAVADAGAGRRLLKKGTRNSSAAEMPAPVSHAGAARIELDRVKRDEVRILTSTAGAPTSLVSRLVQTRQEPGSLGPLLSAVARTLPHYPNINAYFADGAIWRHPHVDLGVAIDLGRGLRVATLSRAGEATAEDLDARLGAAGLRYLDDVLTAEDLAQPSFTITDLRMLGVVSFMPLLGSRQGAILGVSGGRVAGVSMMLTLVFDHRVLAGREAAMFLADVEDALPVGLGVAADSGSAEDAEAPVSSLWAPPTHCDRCWISVSDYHRTNPRDATMILSVRPNGSIGALCHVCAGGL